MKFSDEELTTYLRWQGLPKDFVAADRIEQLVKDVNETHKEAMAAIEMWGAALKSQREAEAKLAKAVDALQYYAFEDVYGIGPARAVLAELEKTE